MVYDRILILLLNYVSHVMLRITWLWAIVLWKISVRIVILWIIILWILLLWVTILRIIILWVGISRIIIVRIAILLLISRVCATLSCYVSHFLAMITNFARYSAPLPRVP